MTKKQIFFFVILILLVASFFRLWQITSVPPGLYPDEAMNGNNALEALETGEYRWFYPENNGREALFMNLQTIPLLLFGNEAWALRILSALFGILTVLGLFLLTKELFKNERIALFSSFFLAVSFWHIMFSRIGFRAIMAPFFLVWSFYLLFKIINKKKAIGCWPLVINSIISGLLFGLGFHSYIAYRVAPLLLILPFYLLWKNRQKKIIAIFLAAAFLAGLPLGVYFLQNPADFMGRTTQVSIFSGPSPVKEILINTAKTIGMLFYKGDHNWRHNLSGEPELWWPVGILFLIGFAISIKKIFTIHRLLLMAWLIIMSLPVVISNEGIPHALRSIILIPPIMILAGLGMEFLWSKTQNFLETKKTQYPKYADQIGRIKKESTALLFIILATMAIYSFNQYFQRWATSYHTYGAFSGRYLNLGKALNRMDNDIEKYVIINANGTDVRNIPMPSQTIMFLTNTFTDKKRAEKNIKYILPTDAEKIICPEKCAVAILETEHALYQTIKNKNPDLKMSIQNGAVEILKNF